MRLSRGSPLILLVLAFGCGPKNLDARLRNAERRSTEAEKKLDEAETKLKAVEPEDAEGKLDDARQALEDPDVAYYPEREMIRQRLDRDVGFLPAVRKERDKRKLEKRVAERREKVEEALAVFEKSTAAIEHKSLEADALRPAENATKELKDALEDGKDLEPLDTPYAAYAKLLRERISKVMPELSLARKRIQFADGPGKLRKEGTELMTEAKAEKDKEDRKDKYQDARKRFARCAEEGRELLSSHVLLARASITVDGKVSTAEGIVTACTSQVASLEKKLAAFPRKAPTRAPATPARKARKKK